MTINYYVVDFIVAAETGPKISLVRGGTFVKIPQTVIQLVFADWNIKKKKKTCQKLVQILINDEPRDKCVNKKKN